MIWLTWRQFRFPAAAIGAIVAALALALLIFRLPTATDAFAMSNLLTGRDEWLYYLSLMAMYGLPAVIGAFWGAPLITRELETGTYRLVWNQTVTRGRWLVVKLGLPGLAAIVASGLASLVVTWWANPIDTVGATGSYGARIEPLVFIARGIVPMGYAAFAFILGVTIGILLRRTVVAMAATLVLYVVVQLVVPLLLRPHMMPPDTQTLAINEDTITLTRIDNTGKITDLGTETVPNSWLLSNDTIDASGTKVMLGEAAGLAECNLPAPSLRVPPPQNYRETCFAKLSSLGYQQQLTYQPASRFWALQAIETAFYLVLTALLTWLTFRLVRRHLS
ncbi:ABC transporter permease [Kibdelosporangium philippinense]|uniref:ABC transporter permease n=1 Tax=Kibdelosporangium philippinense TaxID=211113 RepID=A0ABS8ZPL7_9PSEU|nr:ABC transporter permease subunit [Kibdelosporangium philippinense]MCE7008418.1 ABC transporter permease [Kibdelosporangium philippinense]